jgi:hypothetical protein
MMHEYLDGILEAFDLAVKEHGDGYLTVRKQCSKMSVIAPDKLFVVNEDCEKLANVAAAAFHMVVAKTLYVTKRAGLDTSLAIAFLTTRVRAPDTDDWEKLSLLMEYLRGDQDCPLILSGEYDGVLMWYVDAAFVVHPNMHRHIGNGLTMGRGFSIAVSTKQKLNINNLTESELVGANDMMPTILWMWYVDAAFVVHPNMHRHIGNGLTMGRGFSIAVSTKQKLNINNLTESELVGADDMMPTILWTY